MEDWGIKLKNCKNLIDWLNEKIFIVELEQVKLAAARDSWENDDVADSWDAEEEDEEEEDEVKVAEKVVKPSATTVTKKPVSKSSAIEVVEPESEQAKRERMNRLVKESDLENAIALFGISKSEINVDEVLEITKKEPGTWGLSHVIVVILIFLFLVSVKNVKKSNDTNDSGYFETTSPQTWSEFEALSAAIVKKLKTLDSSKHYPNFLETLFRALLSERDVPEIRKLANMASELMQSKQRDKLAQINAKKKAPPSLAGASKKSGGRADMMDFGDDDDYDGF